MQLGCRDFMHNLIQSGILQAVGRETTQIDKVPFVLVD